MSGSTRLCVTCKHFDLYPGSLGYSELTPAEGATISCAKSAWPKEKYESAGMRGERSLHSFDGPAYFRALIRTAETCPHYEEASDDDR